MAKEEALGEGGRYDSRLSAGLSADLSVVALAKTEALAKVEASAKAEDTISSLRAKRSNLKNI